MSFFRTAALGLASLIVVGAASGASAATRWDQTHPRQTEVLARVHHKEHRIVVARREGKITPVQAHRLMVREQRIAREEHRAARVNGGHITRVQQHRLSRQENLLSHRVPG